VRYLLASRNRCLMLLRKVHVRQKPVCLSLQEIRIQRDSSITDYNLPSYFSRSKEIEKVRFRLCRYVFVLHLDRSISVVLACLGIDRTAGLPNGEPCTESKSESTKLFLTTPSYDWTPHELNVLFPGIFCTNWRILKVQITYGRYLWRQEKVGVRLGVEKI
jgi:hypothetical protein